MLEFSWPAAETHCLTSQLALVSHQPEKVRGYISLGLHFFSLALGPEPMLRFDFLLQLLTSLS